MPIYIRRTIFTFFVFVFLVSASAIIFYGSGYRWNGAKNKIEKTGQFSLDSKPRGAVVYINGEPLRGTWKKIIGAPYETTPAVIKNLLPGEWTVEIRKDGYYSWKKQVRVISGKTAIFHGIRLIKNNIPEQLIHGNILQFSAVSDVAIAALTREDFFIYDMRQKTARVLFHADRDPLVSFSARPNADKFFVRTRDRQWIIDSQGKKTDIVPSVRDSSAFEIVRWSENGELFGKTKDGIIRVSSQPLAFEKVAHESPDDFFVRNGRLFSIAGKQKKTVSMRDLKRTESSRIEILTLPGGGSFIDEPSHDIVIQKSTGGIIILSPPLIGNAFNILELDRIRWLSEKKDIMFLGWNDIELWKYTLFGREYGKTLLTRQSALVRKAVFSRIVPAVFFLSNNTITMIDMADNEQNHIQLVAWDQLNGMDLSRNEKDLFLSGTVNGADGLYQVQIVD